MNKELLTLEIIRQVLVNGPLITVAIGELLSNKTDPTVEDIKALTITKTPEEFFK